MYENHTILDDIEASENISQIPFILVRHTIEDQIKNKNNDIDYLEVIFKKCDLMRQETGDPDILDYIDQALLEYCVDILRLLEEEFDINVDPECLLLSELTSVTYALYRIFVIKYEKKMTKIIYKYIQYNEKQLGEIFSTHKRDVSTISNKKKINSKNMANIVSNLYEVIDYIVDMFSDTISFLNFTADECDDIDFTLIRDLEIEYKINTDIGNIFFERYKEEDINIYSTVLSKLSKKFNRKDESA